MLLCLQNESCPPCSLHKQDERWDESRKECNPIAVFKTIADFVVLLPSRFAFWPMNQTHAVSLMGRLIAGRLRFFQVITHKTTQRKFKTYAYIKPKMKNAIESLQIGYAHFGASALIDDDSPIR